MKISDSIEPKSGKTTLAQEVDALIRLYDVTEFEKLREATEPKWWEHGIVVLLFVSALGMLASGYKLIPNNVAAIHWFVMFWVVLFVATLVAVIEFVLRKLRALRRLYELQSRLLRHLMSQEAAPFRDPSSGDDR